MSDEESDDAGAEEPDDSLLEALADAVLLEADEEPELLFFKLELRFHLFQGI